MTPPELRKPYYCLRSNNGVAILSSTDSSSTGASYAASPQGASGGFYLFLSGGLLLPLTLVAPRVSEVGVVRAVHFTERSELRVMAAVEVAAA
jgi:hypothetical protein